jgi:hypothetical protein
VTDQILLDSVAAGVRRLGAALGHADDMGGIDHTAAISGLVAEMSLGLDEAIRHQHDRPVRSGVVEAEL